MKKFVITIIGILFANVSFGVGDFLQLDEITNGQKGYGITTWSGNQVKKFDIEVVGVLKSTPKSGVVIVKSDDEDLKKVGVVAGMSGSPVYIDGKLFGAVAFTWDFLKEPIFGVTPISDMLELEKYQKGYVNLPQDLRYVVPLLISGVSKEVRPLLNSCFSNYGVELIDSFSYFRVHNDTGEGARSNNFSFKPGDAIGINLVTGDLELTAVGTVTYVDGDKVFALGHPAFSGGNVEIPISTVDVLSIVPKQDISFKLGTSKEIVGELKFDGSTGIYAKVGSIPKMVDVSVNVDDDYLYRYKIAKVQDLFPQLLGVVLGESITRSKGIFGEGNVEVSTLVNFSIGTGILRNNFSVNYNDIIPVYKLEIGYYSALTDVVSLISFLNYNPSFKVDIDSVHVDIKSKDLDAGFIVFVVPSKSQVSRGEDVKVSVGIKKFRGDIEIKEFYFRVPAWVQSGTKITLGASSKLTRTLQILSTYSEYMSLDTYEKLYNFVSESLRVDKLIVYMDIPSPNVASGGNVLNLLPMYLIPTVVSDIKNKNFIPYMIETEESESYPFVGLSTAQIVVK
jgi:hypothetical protein